MDGVKRKQKVMEFASKYRYAILILVIGIGLMLLPTGNAREKEPLASEPPVPQPQSNVQQELQRILTQIEGAGRVEVMLTMASGEEIRYQTDIKLSGGENGGQQQNTVIITDGKHAQQGLVSKRIPPTYQGAIVVCQGADQPTVRLAVTDAVSKVTGLNSSRISVLKMK